MQPNMYIDKEYFFLIISNYIISLKKGDSWMSLKAKSMQCATQGF